MAIIDRKSLLFINVSEFENPRYFEKEVIIKDLLDMSDKTYIILAIRNNSAELMIETYEIQELLNLPVKELLDILDDVITYDFL